MLRVKAKWGGFNGAPGYSNFYFMQEGGFELNATDADRACGRIHTFFDSLKLAFPPNVTIQVQNDVDHIDFVDGKLIDIFGVSTRPLVTGTSGAANYSAATGAVVTWRTGGVRNGRRVRGRTFLVPTSSGTFENNGSLVGSWVTTMQTSAAALIVTDVNAPELGIWARPTGPGATDGEWHRVTSATVPDMSAVLRSRRD
jgi:hypothetical protein